MAQGELLGRLELLISPELGAWATARPALDAGGREEPLCPGCSLPVLHCHLQGAQELRSRGWETTAALGRGF